MRHKKVSIIIPVYNNEDFLNKCLDSVINQTFNDSEIIIVNDGSTDGSLMILKSYASAYSNIILVNQENAGQATAINRALDLACGEYIAFVDADDYIENEMIETLYTEAKINKLDLVICNWDRVEKDGSIRSFNDHSEFDNKIFDRNEIIREFLLNKKELIEGYSWNKLIKRSIFQEFKIRYPNIKYEDIPTIFKILTKIKRAKYINRIFYHYVQHNGSISHTKSENNIKGFIEAIQMIKNTLVEENLISEFEDDYFIYSCDRYLTEYSTSREVINSSKELTKTFQKILQPLSLLRFIQLNKSVNSKLFIKVILYKTGLLHIFIVGYHKLRPLLH